MGTRSLISFYEGKTHLVTVYSQYDGYPEGRGRDLAEFILGGQIVNGFSLGAKFGKTFNGFSDLVAQWIAHEKGDSVGNVYIQAKPTATYFKDAWEDYFYTVTCRTKGITIICWENVFGQGPVVIFEGSPAELKEYVLKRLGGDQTKTP